MLNFTHKIIYPLIYHEFAETGHYRGQKQNNATYSPEESGMLVLVDEVGVGTVLEQHDHAVTVPRSHTEHERRSLLVVHAVHHLTLLRVLQEQEETLLVPIHDSRMYRCSLRYCIMHAD